MAFVEIAAPLLVALGVAASLAMAVALRRVLGRTLPAIPSDFQWPGVSILKPLKGLDPGLTANLESFATQDYPGRFEILAGTEADDDPALVVARRILETNRAPMAVFSDARQVGVNPKVNNLVNILERAQEDLILISDSNVRVRPDYLRNLVAAREAAGGGLCWSVFQGAQWGGFWAGLEALQLHGMVMGGMAAAHEIVGTPCALGKSMLLSKADLGRIGGLERFAEYLAEDQVIAEEVVKAELPVSIAPSAIENALGVRTAHGFASRHLRWAKLRRHLSFWNYLAEVLLNPVFLGLVFWAVTRSSWVLAAAGLALVGQVLIDRSTERMLRIRRSIPSYVLSEIVLSVLRGVLWFIPLFSNTVVWRGNRLKLGPRSRITRVTPIARRPKPVEVEV